ncbi:hypothetical protein LCGC14_3168420 [marine sediment metagenome]|uniref:Uncharacterized protein n=1 Tax=marine sediment metagenome TaxID=412755 RepID=A0A0F8Y5G0_9ZZZZ
MDKSDVITLFWFMVLVTVFISGVLWGVTALNKSHCENLAVRSGVAVRYETAGYCLLEVERGVWIRERDVIMYLLKEKAND